MIAVSQAEAMVVPALLQATMTIARAFLLDRLIRVSCQILFVSLNAHTNRILMVAMFRGIKACLT